MVLLMGMPWLHLFLAVIPLQRPFMRVSLSFRSLLLNDWLDVPRIGAYANTFAELLLLGRDLARAPRLTRNVTSERGGLSLSAPGSGSWRLSTLRRSASKRSAASSWRGSRPLWRPEQPPKL